MTLKNQVTALLFLRSRWEDGQSNNPYFFEISKDSDDKNKDDYHASSNLPQKNATGYFSITDSIYSIGDFGGENSTKIFRFSIIDEDTINVYCYKDGSTYKLYRQ